MEVGGEELPTTARKTSTKTISGRALQSPWWQEATAINNKYFNPLLITIA